jgi:hypothetical protein
VIHLNSTELRHAGFALTVLEPSIRTACNAELESDVEDGGDVDVEEDWEDDGDEVMRATRWSTTALRRTVPTCTAAGWCCLLRTSKLR